MTSVLPHILNGLSFGSLLFLVASGLTLAYGLMGALNLAHGAFYALGGYIALHMIVQYGHSYWVATMIAMAMVAVIAIAFERLLLHRLLHDDLPQVVLTIGFAFLIADQILSFFGGRPRTPPRPPGLEGVFMVGNIVFPWYRLVLIGVAIGVYVLLMLAIHQTRIGATIRAAVDDEQMARATGLPVPVVFMAAFGVGAALAAFAGVWGGAFTGLSPGLEFHVLLLALVVVVVGGLGSVTGALVAAVLVGLLDEFGKVLFPSFALFTVYAPVALILAYRPQGLFGTAGRH
jgi:branched-chain amino acid transport system permease protein